MKHSLKLTLIANVVISGCLTASSLFGQTSYNLTVKSGPLRQTFSGFGASQAFQPWNTLTATPRDQMTDMIYGSTGLKSNTVRLWVAMGDSISLADMHNEFNTQYVAGGLINAVMSRGVNTLLLAPGRGPLGQEPVPASMSAHAEKLAEFILQVKNTYGVTINVTGICNEPENVVVGTDGSILVRGWTSTEIAEGIGALRAGLDSRGLTNVKIIAPESSSPDTAAVTVNALADNSTAWNSLYGIASHSYGMLANNDLEVLKNGKSWWMTECCSDGHEYAEDENQACVMVSRFLCDMNHGVDKWIYFQGIGEYDLSQVSGVVAAYLVLYDTSTSSIVPFLKYFYFKQALRTFDVGSVFRKCVSGTEGDMFRTVTDGINHHYPVINAAAGYNPDGSWGMSIINVTGVDNGLANATNHFSPATSYNVTITVEELATTSSKSFTIHRSKANNHVVPSGTVTFVNGVATVAVGPRELVSLRSAATPVAIPPKPTGLTASTINAPVSLIWNNTVKATSWRVKRATVSGGPFTTIATTTTTSFEDHTAQNGIVYYYVVSALSAAGESSNSSQVVSSPAPFPWSNMDIGNPSFAGSWAVSDSGVFTVDGGGANLGVTSDSFNYTYKTMTGNGTFIARLSKAVQTNNSMVGIMMSETLGTAPKAACVMYSFNGAYLHAMMFTRATAGNYGSWAFSTVTAVPTWFKLVRSSNTFTGYASADGVTWTTISSGTIAMASTIYIGMVDCSNNSGLCTATFDNVSTPADPPTGVTQTASPGQFKLGWTASHGATSYKVKRATAVGGPYTTRATVNSATLSYVDTTIVSGMNYYYAVSAVNARGESANSTPLKAWQNVDIGPITAPGKCISDGSSFNVSTAGSDIGSPSDSFNVTYRTMTGDGTLIARLAWGTAGGNGQWGIMMSETLGTSPKAVGVFYDYNGAWLRSFMWVRHSAGNYAQFFDSPATPPTWFKLVRVGNVFTGSVSPDGTSWTTINSATIPMASTIYMGLNGCSSNTSFTAAATFDQITAP